jgi:peptide/nickel transport system permease protein
VIRFLIDRLLALIPVLVMVLVIIFSLSRLIPGDPAVTLLGPGATKEQISALREQLNLDQPVAMQFYSYVSGLAHGDMGKSMKSGRPVFQEILNRLPSTIELSVMATLLAIILGIPVGVLSAIRANSMFDHVTRVAGPLNLCSIRLTMMAEKPRLRRSAR